MHRRVIIVAAIVPALDAVGLVDGVAGCGLLGHVVLLFDNAPCHVKVVETSSTFMRNKATTSKRRDDVLALPIRLDRGIRGQPQQVHGALRAAIVDGLLAPGVRLPSTRSACRAAWGSPQRDRRGL